MLNSKTSNVQLWMTIAEALLKLTQSRFALSNFTRFYQNQPVRFHVQWQEVCKAVYIHLNSMKYRFYYEDDHYGLYLYKTYADYGIDTQPFNSVQEMRRYASKWVHVRQSTLHEDVCIITNSWSRHKSLDFGRLFKNQSNLREPVGFQYHAWFIEVHWPASIQNCSCSRCHIMLEPTSLGMTEMDGYLICRVCKREHE